MEQPFEIKENYSIIKINKNLYPKETLIQTTYVLLDEFYFFIDENEKYFLVRLEHKENQNPSKQDLEKYSKQFLDEIIESQSYIDQMSRTSKIRETILEKALLSQTIDEDLLEELEKN